MTARLQSLHAGKRLGGFEPFLLCDLMNRHAHRLFVHGALRERAVVNQAGIFLAHKIHQLGLRSFGDECIQIHLRHIALVPGVHQLFFNLSASFLDGCQLFLVLFLQGIPRQKGF